METLPTILQEIIGLFVDDGSLALALVIWCAAVGLAHAALPTFAAVWGPALFLGCTAILLFNVMRSAWARASKSH